MELWSIWRVLRRRWWLALIPAVVVGAVALGTYQSPPPSFGTTLRFTVGQTPVPLSETGGYDRYYSWTASEYIANGLVDWVRGGAFAGQVSDLLRARGVEVPSGTIQGAIAADNARSMLSLNLTWSSPDGLRLLVPAVVEVLQTKNATAFPQLRPEGAIITPIDPVEPVNVYPLAPSTTSRLGLILRLGLALAAGIGLAFLIEYLDPTVRDRQDLAGLGLNVMAEIPRRG